MASDAKLKIPALPDGAAELLAAYREVHTIPPRVEERIWATVKPRPAWPRIALVALAVAAVVVAVIGLRGRLLVPTQQNKGAEAAVDAHDGKAVEGEAERTSELRTDGPARPRPATKTDPTPPEPAPAEPAANETGTAAPRRPAARAPRRDRAPKPPEPEPQPQPSVSDETRLLEQATKALATGDITRALRLTTEHRRRFPKGAFIPERRAIEVIAGCKKDDPNAGPRARAFLNDYPRSSARGRVQQACKDALR